MSKRDEEERREDLTATSESLQDDARQIAQIEDEKQDLDIDDPRLDKLSRDAERLAGDVVRKSRVERALSEEGPTEPDEPRPQSN
ncbi:MAG TPA: hypothetical protein VEX41_11470 [Candidatus Eisenbacteria bacterium]|nr:hypothetical protein [Candidatus Eisenbacteria bacterium]